jgi:hypothetical protein
VARNTPVRTPIRHRRRSTTTTKPVVKPQSTGSQPQMPTRQRQ